MAMVHGKIGFKTVPCYIFLGILLCISLAIILDFTGTGEEAFLNVLVDPSINENQVGLLWINCRQDLNDLLQGFEDSKLRRLEETFSNVGHPELEQALFNCIFQISRESFEPLFPRHDVPRRILAPKDTAEASSLDSPDSEAPDIIITPTPASSHLPKPSNRPPPSVSNSNPGNGDSDDKGALNKKTIIIASIVTVLVTASVALLLFFLCFRNQITMWPISGGEKLDHQSLGNESSLHQKVSTDGSIDPHMSSDGKPSLGAIVPKASAESSDTSGNTNSTLPPPLGRAGTSAPGVPPVNVLSGGSDPLPPEPPNPVSANPPPAQPGSVSVPRPTGTLPPPKPPGAKSDPRPPAPPRSPPPMPPGPKVPKPPSRPQGTPNVTSGEGSNAAGDDATASKAKLKPFFWDKVAAKPDHAMVWNQIKSGSFKFNEELIKTLFGYSAIANNKNNGKKELSTQDNAPQRVQLLEPKKAQNLAILFRALNVTTEEVYDALREGSELPVEVLQTLLKMAPTSDEELKLRMFRGETSQLGSMELFLKHLLDIPFSFKRMDTLLFMCSLNEEVSATKESFETLEVACKDLSGSRIFLKLLEAVLKTGNRMNDGTLHGGAQAFKLDALLKLSDVKGADGKTTLLHFVVQEIIRTEGLKAARVERESRSSSSINSDDLLEDVSHDMEEHYRSLGFQAVSRLSSELENVKKAAALDVENLTGTVAKLGHSLLKARDFLNSEMKGSEKDSCFHNTLKSFVEKAEVDVKSLLEEEKRIMELVKYTANYFHGNNQKDEGLRLFVIVRDFLIILDKVCKEDKDKPVKSHKKEGSHASSSSESRNTPPFPDPRQKLFPTIAEQRVEDSSSMSDDD